MTRTHMLALALFAAPAALAITPKEGVRTGHEPVRVRTYDAATQNYFARQPAWQDFVATSGPTWQARFDERTGTPHRMWGKGIALGKLHTSRDVERALTGFIAKHADLLGVGGGDPKITRTTFIDRMDAWYADATVFREGLPVWRSGITFRIKHDKLTMVGADTYPHAAITGAFTRSATEAIDAFIDEGPAPRSLHREATASQILLPREAKGTVHLRRVWHVKSRTSEPLGHWEAFVDGETGTLLAFFNTVRFFDGTITTEHDTRLGDGTLTTSPLTAATVSSSTETTQTDGLGAFFLTDDDAGYEVRLTGDRVDLTDELPGGLTPVVTDPVTALTAADWGDRLAPATTFLAIQEVQDFAYGLAPEVGWTSRRTTATVNIDDTCNAWFDGEVNFLRSGDGCNNTGRQRDVIFHEWGHGFHAYSLASGDFDGSLGEGAADTMSFLLTDDSRIAPNFFTGGGTLRDANNDRRYPEAYRGNEQFIHSNGMIFSGAMWDTREALRERYDHETADQVLGAIFAGLLKGGPDLETAYDEAVFADDDNADLSDGTPHQCELVEGFGLHGLGPVGGFGIAPEGTGRWQEPADVDVDIRLAVPNPAPNCFDVSPTGGVVHWQVNDGTWTQTPLAVDGGDVVGTIPQDALNLGDVVTYYTTIETSVGATVTEPSQGVIRPHTFHVGDVLEVACNSFENAKGGFTSRLLAGDDVEGANDWQIGEPFGKSGDPDFAYSGRIVWGNDLGEGEYNGAYQDNRHNQLRSRVYDTAHYKGTFLQYMRWLNVEDGVFDNARILADDVLVWSNYASGNEDGGSDHRDDRWEPHVVDLGDLGDDGELRIAWEIVSDAGLFFGGWTLDDICIYAPATADNRLGITDFEASRDDGIVTLSWTMPKHAPVSEVRVVRKQGDWPTSADDGEVVFETTTITLEEATIATDETRDIDLFYAVYASDGDAWLSWTEEGWNAAAVDALPPGEEVAACGCDQRGTPAGWTWMLGVVGLLGLRRRA